MVKQSTNINWQDCLGWQPCFAQLALTSTQYSFSLLFPHGCLYADRESAVTVPRLCQIHAALADLQMQPKHQYYGQND